MNYSLIKDTFGLVEEFEKKLEEGAYYAHNMEGFKRWIADQYNAVDKSYSSMEWEGKVHGRSPESVISTLLVHMNRYAKLYSKAAMHDSEFSTQEEFIFLIVLKSFGAMSKMDLIKKNIQEKPAGMKLIDRLVKQGWADQVDSSVDKRSKMISITPKGIEALDLHMDKIRQATKIVAGNLTEKEKTQLITLLTKLEDFHQEIYNRNIAPSNLLETVLSENFSY